MAWRFTPVRTGTEVELACGAGGSLPRGFDRMAPGGDTADPIKERHHMSTRRASLTVSLVLVALASTGCTTRAWYEATRVHAQNECRRQPSGESESCLSRVNAMTYDDYERQRSGGKP
jgi:hypothetical protein